MNDLSLVSTDDMLKELSKRYDSLVFIGLFDRTKDNYRRDFFSTGHAVTCLGLAAIISQWSRDQMNQQGLAVMHGQDDSAGDGENGIGAG